MEIYKVFRYSNIRQCYWKKNQRSSEEIDLPSIAFYKTILRYQMQNTDNYKDRQFRYRNNFKAIEKRCYPFTVCTGLEKDQA